MESSVFSTVPVTDWVASNGLVFAIRDRFPVSPGHTLVVTKRVVADWWQATLEERAALLDLVDVVKADLDGLVPAPDGYNIGVNVGVAAGQTVAHLHMHVIPRYVGDLPDPRGGVRHVIPGMGNYLVTRSSSLRSGPQTPLAPTLRDCLSDVRLDRIDLAVSFVMRSGLDEIDEDLGLALSRPGTRVRLLTTDYLGITEKVALERLLMDMAERRDSLEVRLFTDPSTSFHPKAYVFTSTGYPGVGFGLIGSANLSRGGLAAGVEWTLQTTDPVELVELRTGFDRLWEDPRVRVLTAELVDAYKEAPRAQAGVSMYAPLEGGGVAEDPAEASHGVSPTPLQGEALIALEQTRADGFGAGLVVMATGLGKTWLAGFDTSRPAYQRVLFLAHREEILRQARSVFRQVQPTRSTGLLLADTDESHADVVFASVQTFSRRLRRYRPDEFDYVVVDEFHHASAPTYRRILGHLTPRFLLGLTATPDRSDGADLLALCDDNLVHETTLAEGIEAGALVPFHYRGVADTIDFRPIPWRNGRFDPHTLGNAAVTLERAQASLREWRAHGGARTLAFCVSVRHAEFMAEFFTNSGVKAVAVHASPGSAPRNQSLDDLARGDLQVIFSVDLFSEGVDVPTVDTVLMLRPTESPVLFLQQLGRGLRRAEGKTHLRVVDFIGNHRSFLRRPRLLLGLGGTPPTEPEVRRAVRGGRFELPAGCRVDYSLEAMEILRNLDRASGGGQLLARFITEHQEQTGRRPTAVEAYRAGINPAAANKDGGWFSVLDSVHALSDTEIEVLRSHGEFLRALATEPMTKAYKMVTLKVMLLADTLVQGMPVPELSAAAHRLVCRDPRLLADTRSASMPHPESLDAAAWAEYWRRWPIAAWLGELSGKGQRWFTVNSQIFQPAFKVDPAHRDALTAMTAEILSWRLARYLDTKNPPGSGDGDGDAGIVLALIHSGARPILSLDRHKHPNLPQGTGVEVIAADRSYAMDFVKVAVNVARLGNQSRNVLPDLLWSWFGGDAGQPGTHHRVVLQADATGTWHLTPKRAADNWGAGIATSGETSTRAGDQFGL